MYKLLHLFNRFFCLNGNPRKTVIVFNSNGEILMIPE